MAEGPDRRELVADVFRGERAVDRKEGERGVASLEEVLRRVQQRARSGESGGREDHDLA